MAPEPALGSSGEEKTPFNWRNLSSTRPAASVPWPLSQCASSRKHCVTNPESDNTTRRWCLSVFILTVCICHCTHWQRFQCHRSWPQRCNNFGNLHQCQPLTLWALWNSPLVSYLPQRPHLTPMREIYTMAVYSTMKWIKACPLPWSRYHTASWGCTNLTELQAVM